jgi:hypothetical protein
MSFIDLMADVVWSKEDIARRAEATLRSEFSEQAETVLNRKVLGIIMGSYTPTPEDQAEIARYQTLAFNARSERTAALHDMDRLADALAFEEAARRLEKMSVEDARAILAAPEADPEVDPDLIAAANAVLNGFASRGFTEAQASAVDQMERAAAQAVVSGANHTTLDLVATRGRVALSEE